MEGSNAAGATTIRVTRADAPVEFGRERGFFRARVVPSEASQVRADTSEPRLRVERTIDSESGAVEHRYYWEGDLAPNVEISGPLVDRIGGLALIKKDLDSALKWVMRAEQLAGPHLAKSPGNYFKDEDRETFDQVKAFFVAALVFYAKCFTEAEGRKVQGHRDWIGKDHQDAHDYFMTLRHSFAAHSGKEQVEYSKTYVLIQPDKKAFIPMLPTVRIQPDIATSADAEKGLIELIQHVSAVVAQKYDETTQKVIHELIVPRGVGFWSEAAERGDTVALKDKR